MDKAGVVSADGTGAAVVPADLARAGDPSVPEGARADDPGVPAEVDGLSAPRHRLHRQQGFRCGGFGGESSVAEAPRPGRSALAYRILRLDTARIGQYY